MYVAVVMKHLKAGGVRPGAVTGATRDEAIKRAIKVRDEWRGRVGYSRNEEPLVGPFRIFVGELTTEIVEPVRYEEVPLSKELEADGDLPHNV